MEGPVRSKPFRPFLHFRNLAVVASILESEVSAGGCSFPYATGLEDVRPWCGGRMD